ncbi:MAG: M48 family peptidase [Phenylobacterium sp.]|nr:MAG: M48 family peptidase [Phenylobacterium sp.]
MIQGFNPAAATAAYLAQLPPELHAKAKAYTQGGHWLLLWGAVVAVIVALIILRSGVLVRVRNGVERGKPRPWLAVAAVIAVSSLAELVLGLPWDAYSSWWREKSYGLTSQPFAGWLSEHLLGAVISIVLLVILASLVYALIRRAPRTWWLWATGVVTLGFFAFNVLQPILIEPLFNTYTPAPPGAMRDTVVAMAKQAGVPSDKILIYNGSKQSNRYSANVAGAFGTARVAMSDVMFKKDADLAEVRAVVGHEMGHYVLGHWGWLTFALGVVTLIGLFLVDRLFGLVLRLTGAKGVSGLADPAGYPVVGILLAVLGLLGTPIVNSVIRITEAQADHFSLVNFNEPDGLARALVKTIEYRYDSPGRLEEVIFYDHPAVARRIRAAMDWKAAHPKPTPSAS